MTGLRRRHEAREKENLAPVCPGQEAVVAERAGGEMAAALRGW